MSGKNRHKGKTKHESAPSLIGLCDIESTDTVARLQRAASDTVQRTQPAPNEEPSSPETFATLLRAVESTEFAARLQQAEAESHASQRPQPAPKEEPNRHETLASLLRAIETTALATDLQQAEADPGPQLPPLIARPKVEIRRLAQKIERLSTWLQNCFPIDPPPGPPPDPRRCPRLFNPPLVAYYWTGGTPKPQPVADISLNGIYLLTQHRLLPGTRVFMALQRTDQERETPEWWIAMDVMIMRHGRDGFGGAFVASTPGLARPVSPSLDNCGNKEALERFMKHLTVSDQL